LVQTRREWEHQRDKAMNTLRLIPLDPVTPGRENPDRAIWLFFRIEIDGVPIEASAVANLNVLSSTAESSGTYQILVCPCGDPGCDVIAAEVEVTTEAIKWCRLSRSDDSGRHPTDFSSEPLIFNRAAYSDAIEQAKEYVRGFELRRAPVRVMGPTGQYYI
jgi:hypothetical protein